MNNFSGFWGVGAVPSCLVPGPGVIRAGGQCGPVYESRIEEMRVSVISGLAGLHLKGTFMGLLFTVCRNWLAPGGRDFPESAGLKISKH